MAESDAVGPVVRPRLATVVISNAALLITVVGATFGFAGFTYYEELFSNFGLKPFSVELNNIDIASHGAYAVTWAIWSFIDTYWFMFLVTIVSATLIGGVLGIGTTLWPKLKELLNRSRPILKHVHRLNNRLLWFMGAFLIFGVGFTAGSTAAKRDFAYFKQARQRATNCYRIKGNIVRGVPLAQDKEKIILVRRNSTIVLPFDEMEIAACKSKPTKATASVRKDQSPTR